MLGELSEIISEKGSEQERSTKTKKFVSKSQEKSKSSNFENNDEKYEWSAQ